MTVRLRLKKLGRKHRPFFRLCAMDSRSARDGKVIEELGYYDPMVSDTDARAILNGERIDYWLKVGAQPSEKAHVLIKKYGANGTHLEQQKAALDRIKQARSVHYVPPAPKPRPTKQQEAPAEGQQPEQAAPQAEAGDEAAGEQQ